MAAPVPVIVPSLNLPCRQPLPTNHYHPVNERPIHEAYNQCLQTELEAGNNERLLMCARCLGHLIHEAPDTAARTSVAEEINRCNGDRVQMNLLAEFYINYLIRLFRQDKGPTPTPSTHSSRSGSFDEQRSLFGAAVEPAPKDHTTAKHSALRRDGYRCMVTGMADLLATEQMTDAEQQRYNVGGLLVVTTNYCHIFPPSSNWDLKPEENGHPKTHYSGNIWGIVNSFANISVLDELDGENMHRLSNGLTLQVDLRILFDALKLWFEEVPNQPHTYDVHTFRPHGLLPRPRRVTFRSTNPALELPDPKYLKLHAAVCRVAHMSGAARYLDLHGREVEKRKFMAHDGSSAELLDSRLHRVVLTM